MKPTEADIQAELIEGWELNEYFDPVEDKIRIKRQFLAVAFYVKSREVIFNYNGGCEIKILYMDEFLKDASSLCKIAQFYTSPEWSPILDMCRSIVRLITGEQEPQSLEEKVREIFSRWGYIKRVEVLKGQVVVRLPQSTQYIFAHKIQIKEDSEETPREYEINSFLASNSFCKEWTDAIRETSLLLAFEKSEPPALLTDQPEQTLEEETRLTYSELQERVAELETEVIQQKREADTFREQSNKFDAENIKYFNRIRELQAELQSSVSEADYEREIKNHQELLARVTLQRDDAREQAEMYRQWFEIEYAKNAEARG